MGSIRLNISFRALVPLLLVSLSMPWACSQNDRSGSSERDPGTTTMRHWYRQATVDLGARITMTSLSEGVAISRGMGRDVKGKAYRFAGGQWVPFHEFPYSDFPMIVPLGSDGLWTVTHRTHDGAYRPVFEEHISSVREIPLPRVMWDAVDHVMYKDIHRFPDGTAWMVGQQGHIIYYNGNSWKEVPSPLIEQERSSVYQGDLNALAMTSQQSGWAVGRNGVIIRYVNGTWQRVTSPTTQTLTDIAMSDEQTGWAVGNSGTILRCENGEWRTVPSDVRDQLLAVTVHKEKHAWIVGNNSVMLEFDGTVWRQDATLKMYDDLFADISVVRDTAGAFHLWIIGNQGIYTNSQSLGVSFTDITEQAGLRRIGRAGTFIRRSDQGLPDLLVANDGGTSLLYENRGSDLFADVTGETALLHSPKDALVIAVGDVNNDGETDILELVDHRVFGLYLGTGDGEFRDFTERSGLSLQEIDPLKPIAAKFVDLDNDGALDLYISNYDLSDQCFLGDGTGRFSAVPFPPGLHKITGHASYGAVFADFDTNGTTDILLPYYVSARDTFFTLFLNEGGLRFRQQSDPLFISAEDRSPTAVTAADVNNDGAVDLYIHSQKIAPMLWLNDGTGKFRDVSASYGFTAYAGQLEPINGIVGSADVNQDGWIDIFAGSRLFLNNAGRSFTEVSERVGIQFTGTPSFADIDGDGDQDLFIGSSRATLGKGDRAALFRNNLDNTRFIKVCLEGVHSNRSAVGARVEVFDRNGGRQLRAAGGGGSQLTTQDLHEMHFGLREDGPVNVRVHFPSGIVRELQNIDAGSVVTVREAGMLESLVYRSMDWVMRSGRLISFPSWIVLLSLFALLVVMIFLLSARTGTRHFVVHPLHLVSVAAGFLWAAFFTAYEHPAVTALASTVIAGSFSAGYLYGMMKLKQHKEAHFIGRYRIGALLGTGGMGKVYRGTDTVSKQTVAVKVLNTELLKDPENRRRLSAEGHVLASFNHPHIVKVFEIGESEARGYIAMEYLPGGTLRELLEKERVLPVERIRALAAQICDGVEAIHANGIIHRDLKTGNVMLDEKGNIRIMDFGLSKSPLVSTMTSLGTVLGTLGYVAPEQVTGVTVDARTDIFSFGVILYELLTGELPFKGENEIALIHAIFNTVPPPPSQLRNGIPVTWDAVVMKCLAKDAAERYGSMTEVRSTLNAL